MLIEEGSLHRIELAPTISAEPTTKRMRSKPVPGQPPANVEYRCRKYASLRSLLVWNIVETNRNPKKSCDGHSLEFFMRLGRVSSRWKLQLDDSSFQADRCGVGSIIGAQFGKDGLDSTLDGLLGDLELIRDLLIGISGCDQA